MNTLADRCRLMFALCALALLTFSLAGCGGGDPAVPEPPLLGQPGGGGGGGDPDPQPVGPLSGAPADPAVAAVTDVYTGPAAAGDFDETGMLLSRILVQFRRDATVAEVNAAIDAVDGEIAYSRPGSLAMDLTIPRAQDFQALEGLLDLLESQPGVIAATWDAQAQVEILPRDLSGQPVDPDTLRHLLPTRFPAAWNAAGLLTDTNCDRPLRIIMPDAFARAEPDFFVAKVAPDLFVADEANRRGFLDDADTHGYLVALTMLGRHDERPAPGALPVGVAPGASCVRVEAIEKLGLGSTDLALRLSERLGTPDTNVIVQISLGFAVPQCDRDGPTGGLEDCTGEFTGLTQQRLERALMYRIEATLRWAAAGISEPVNRHALFVVAAGNERNDPIAVLYPGFGNGRFGLYPQMLASLLELDRDFGSGVGIPAADLWTPRADAAIAAGFTPPAQLTRITLSEDYLAEKRIEFAELDARQRALQALDATLVVGSTSLPAFDASRTDASGLAPSAFSNTVVDPRGIMAVGEGLSLGVVRRTRSGVETDRVNGTSYAAPQVSGLAAYLWLLSPELRALPAADTLRHIVENAQFSERIPSAGVIDAYAAVLALDQFDDERPIRQAILDVNGDGRFDDRDIELYLEAFEASREESFNLRTDFSRFDLNGDGRTGGARTVPMDLDGYTFDAFGRAVLSEQTTMRIEGVEITFNEFAVSDLQALCYFAYEPLGLYRGTPERRSEALGGARCVPIELSTVFPERFTGDADLDVLVTLPVIGPTGATVQEPVADLLVRFSPTCATVSEDERQTNESGRASVRVTPEPDCNSVSVRIDVLDSGEVVIASEIVTAQIGSGMRFLGCDPVARDDCPQPFPRAPDSPYPPANNYANSVTGGTEPRTYLIIEGNLPTGLSLNEQTGLVSGIPTEPGLYLFRVEVISGLDGITFWDRILIGPRVASIEVTPSSASLAPGGQVALTATLRADDGSEILSQSVVWTSSDIAIATVQVTGARSATVTARGDGTATISASRGGVSGTATIEAQAPPEPLRIIEFNPQLIVLPSGDIEPYQLRHSGGVGTVRWQAGPITFIPRDDGQTSITVSESGVVSGRWPNCVFRDVEEIVIPLTLTDDGNGLDFVRLPFNCRER